MPLDANGYCNCGSEQGEIYDYDTFQICGICGGTVKEVAA